MKFSIDLRNGVEVLLTTTRSDQEANAKRNNFRILFEYVMRYAEGD